MKLMPFVAPLCLLLLAADQPKQTTPTYLETLEVTVSNLDVVVTDKHGKNVSGLTAADFDVRENGTPQTITNFSAYAVSAGTINVPATETRQGTQQPAVTAPPPRKFVFFIDDMSIHPEARGKLNKDAHRFIETQMRPGDEGMIVTPANAMKGELTFTADRAAIDKEIATMIDKSTFRTNTPQLSEQFFYDTVVSRATGEDYINKAKIYATRVNRRVTTTLRALLGVVGSLTQTEGKKILVIMSTSLTSEPGREAFRFSQVMNANNQNISPDEFSGRNAFDTNNSRATYWYDAQPMIRELGARATANGITIYTIQPNPGFAVGPTGLSAGSPPPRLSQIEVLRGVRIKPTAQTVSAAEAAVSPFQQDINSGTGTTLGSLAEATGGKFWRGIGDFDAAFRTMASDLDSYYSIGYRVSGAQNAIHHIDVSVKGRPDLVVRTRRDVMRYSPEREMDEIATTALLTTKDVNELGITASAGPPARTIDAYKVEVAVKIPLGKLTFIPQGDKYEAQFSVHYAAADGANYTTGEMRQQTLQVPASDIDVVRTHSYTYTSTLVVAPGTARISVGVFDKLSRLSGFQRLSVEAR